MNKKRIITLILSASLALTLVVVIAVALVTPPSPPITPKITYPSAGSDFEAAEYEFASLADTVSANENAPDFTSVGGTFLRGNYMVYPGIDFEDGKYNTMLMTISAGFGQADKTIDIYIDDIFGTKIGSITVQQTLKKTEFLDHYAAIESVSGVHDLYIVFPENLDASIDFFTFSTYDGTESEEERENRMSWWNNAKYGQFIHWGPYAQLGGTYGGESVVLAEWIMDELHIPKEEYANAAAKPFSPTAFDAASYVSNAKASGQKYLIFTSRHHDGFSMYDTKIREFKDYSLFSFANNGNYNGIDPVMEISKECEKQGIVFGVYYTIMDWHDVSQENWGADMDMYKKAEFKTRIKAQLRELVEDYGAQVIFFDGEWMGWWYQSDGRELYRYLRTLNPDLIINNRIGKRDVADGDYGTPEQEIPSAQLDYDWESCMTLNNSWGYHSTDNYWKGAGTVIANLIKCTSNGGNYLLNVGPDANGAAPAEGTAILLEVGKWLETYGESIYNTSPGCFTNLPYGVYATTKEGKIYLHITGDNTDTSLPIPNIKNEIIGIKAIGTDKQLNYKQGKSSFVIDLSGLERNEYVTVIEIDVAGIPEQSDSTVDINYSAEADKIIASNEYAQLESYSGAMAADGDRNTRWATDINTKKAELILEFDEPITVNSAYILHYNESRNDNWINNYTIDYWNGNTWVTAYTGGKIDFETNIYFYDVSSTKFRLNITDCRNPSIYEFRLFNKKAD